MRKLFSLHLLECGLVLNEQLGAVRGVLLGWYGILEARE